MDIEFVLRVVGGGALATLMLAALALAGSACAHRLRGDGGASPCEVALDIALFAGCLAMFEVSSLVELGLGAPWQVCGVVILSGLGALAFDGRAALAQLREVGAAALRSLSRSWTPWPIVLLALLLLARALVIPPLAWDGLTYHLTYPASWLVHGGQVALGGGGSWDTYQAFPKGSEALFFLAMAPFGRDYLVGLSNLPLYLGLALAVRVACRRGGVGARGQDLTALCVLASPAFFAYVVPAYTEVAQGMLFATMLACGLRALDDAQPRQLLPMWLACGAAVGVKFTALGWAGWPVMVTLLCARQRKPGILRWAVSGLGLGALVAAPWLLANTVQCGNPLYPAPLPGLGGGGGGAAGSLLSKWSMEESSVLTQRSIGRVLEYLAIAPWGARYPLGPFWPYLAALALPALLLPSSSGRARSRALGLWLMALYMLDLYLVMPYNGLYVDANTRFLGPSLIAAVLACAFLVAALPRRVAALLALLAAVVALAYVPLASPVRKLEIAHPAAAVAGLVLAALVAAALALRSGTRVRSLGVVAGCLLLAACALTPWTLAVRERERQTRYLRDWDLHPVPGSSKAIWPVVDRLPPSRIAFAVGGVDFTEGWFFYPLFGADLRHSVTYVDIEADGETPGCMRRGLTRDQPDRAAWLARLERERIDYLVFRGRPLEYGWVGELPERFVLHTDARTMSLWRVIR